MSWSAVAGAATTIVGGSLLGNNSATNASADATNLESQIASDQWNRYKQIYSPLENEYVQEAQNYDTPQQYAKAAGQASATVSDQFSKANQQLDRTPGLDPSSGAYTAAKMGLNLAQAASDATAQNQARQQVKDTAWARKTDALSLGKGLAATASSELGSVANQGLNEALVSNKLGLQEASALGNVGSKIGSWLGKSSSGNSGNVDTGTVTGNDMDVWTSQ